MGLVLPGAEQFAAYLESLIEEGSLEMRSWGETERDRFGGMDETWIIYHREAALRELGKYHRTAVDDGHLRLYAGKLPHSTRLVFLQWTNVYVGEDEHGLCLPPKKVPWHRGDRYLDIPFP
jgi:hypothetical protein